MSQNQRSPTAQTFVDETEGQIINESNGVHGVIDETEARVQSRSFVEETEDPESRVGQRTYRISDDAQRQAEEQASRSRRTLDEIQREAEQQASWSRRTLEEIQREAEQQLQSSERILNASKHSRASPRSAHQSRAGSHASRHLSNCEDDTETTMGIVDDTMNQTTRAERSGAPSNFDTAPFLNDTSYLSLGDTRRSGGSGRTGSPGIRASPPAVPRTPSPVPRTASPVPTYAFQEDTDDYFLASPAAEGSRGHSSGATYNKATPPAPGETYTRTPSSTAATYTRDAPSPAPTYTREAPSPAPTYTRDAPSPAPTYTRDAPSPAPTYTRDASSPAPTYTRDAPSPAVTYTRDPNQGVTYTRDPSPATYSRGPPPAAPSYSKGPSNVYFNTPPGGERESSINTQAGECGSTSVSLSPPPMSPYAAAARGISPLQQPDSSRGTSSGGATHTLSSMPSSCYISFGSRLTPSPYSVATSRDYSSGGSVFSPIGRPAAAGRPGTRAAAGTGRNLPEPMLGPPPPKFISSPYAQYSTPSAEQSPMPMHGHHGAGLMPPDAMQGPGTRTISPQYGTNEIPYPGTRTLAPQGPGTRTLSPRPEPMGPGTRTLSPRPEPMGVGTRTISPQYPQYRTPQQEEPIRFINMAGYPDVLRRIAQMGATQTFRGSTPFHERKDLSGLSWESLEFLDICNPRQCAAASDDNKGKLPRKPWLSPEELEALIGRESDDVESASFLTSEERRTYKKPCPKQMKAQMTVKQIINSHGSKPDTCFKEYSALAQPDPEDISPELAAAMMFAHEKGIKLESCPHETIKHLFPEEYNQFGMKVPPSNVSIVDPNQKDKEELIEKSAAVPSEGVSDSAYTRTMKQKGEDLGSVMTYDLDFALGQGKREYVLVAQKPQRFNKIQFRGNVPPWFPGYFAAFPDQAEPIRVMSSPSTVFHKAWVTTNPGAMPPSDVIVLD